MWLVSSKLDNPAGRICWPPGSETSVEMISARIGIYLGADFVEVTIEQFIDAMRRAPRLRFQQLSHENDDIVDGHVMILLGGIVRIQAQRTCATLTPAWSAGVALAPDCCLLQSAAWDVHGDVMTVTVNYSAPERSGARRG